MDKGGFLWYIVGMDFIDTHCHIHSSDYPLDAEAAVEAARAAGVGRMICIGTSLADSERAVKFAEAHDEVYAALGVHPHEEGISDNSAKLVGAVEKLAGLVGSQKVVAIGEVGLDYHYTPFDREAQIRLMEEQIQLAVDNNLPIVFHVREAYEDFWPAIDNFHGLRGVVHSFSDNRVNLDAALERGLMVGVNGLATFAPIPLPTLGRMILETDAPYLAPSPYRGKPNQPAYIPDIASWLADKLVVPIAEVAKVTTNNAVKLFGL
jgi:TatD DNase family protein